MNSHLRLVSSLSSSLYFIIHYFKIYFSVNQFVFYYITLSFVVISLKERCYLYNYCRENYFLKLFWKNLSNSKMSSFNNNNNNNMSSSSSTNSLESQMKNVPFEDQLLYKTWLLMAAQQHSPGISLVKTADDRWWL